MNESLPFIEIIILSLPLVALVMVIKQMSDEIEELKEKLEQSFQDEIIREKEKFYSKVVRKMPHL